MHEILSALADLTALRERESLEEALVRLVRKQVCADSSEVRLVRLIGEPGSQHWQVRARMATEMDTQERDTVWADWSHLPRSDSFPQRLAALEQASPVRTGAGAPTLIFAVDREPLTGTVLEVVSTKAIDPQSEYLINRLLAIYRNLIGLLDYGEKDALTGLLNRKSFDGAFVRAAMMQDALPVTEGQPNRRRPHDEQSFWLAVMDIDHFKRINDSFGHLIGDEVLILMARIMRNSLRSQDQLYRFGGEEFVILLRCPSHEATDATLERFRQKVEQFVFPQAGRVTVSIGFTALRSDDTPGLAFDRADQAVYQAKSGGRNQVCSFADLVAAGTVTDAATAGEQEVDFF